jgi:hypothetical protein
MAVRQVLGSPRFIDGQAGGIAFVFRYIKEAAFCKTFFFN